MERIVLFDGVCNFCNGSVNFIIRNDPNGKFKFAPLQSEIGQQLRAKHGIGETRFYALFLANNGRGNTPTVEEQGMGLLWLAALLRPREHRVRPGMLLTQRERVRMFPRGRFDVVLDRAPDQDRRAAAARASATPAVRSRRSRGA